MANIQNGSEGFITCKYITNGDNMFATYPKLCINATPCTLTTVGRYSAEICCAILYDQFTQNLPAIIRPTEAMTETNIDTFKHIFVDYLNVITISIYGK